VAKRNHYNEASSGCRDVNKSANEGCNSLHSYIFSCEWRCFGRGCDRKPSPASMRSSSLRICAVCHVLSPTQHRTSTRRPIPPISSLAPTVWICRSPWCQKVCHNFTVLAPRAGPRSCRMGPIHFPAGLCKRPLNHGQHSRNFPKTFRQNLPTSDDLGMPKKFSYPNSQTLSLRFLRSSSFLISVD